MLDDLLTLMIRRNFLVMAAVAGTLFGTIRTTSAVTILADTVLDFFNSGVGSLPGPDAYGGIYPGGSYPVAVPKSYAADGNPTTFVSLPTDSYITLGFSSGFVFDGPGLDIFVSELGGNTETADIYVSSDNGATFTLLGTATTATVSGFDLGDIGFTGHVNAVKVVGLDNFGSSAGFDLAYVQGLEGSVVETTPDVLSSGWALFGALISLPLFARLRGVRSVRLKAAKNPAPAKLAQR